MLRAGGVRRRRKWLEWAPRRSQGRVGASVRGTRHGARAARLSRLLRVCVPRAMRMHLRANTRRGRANTCSSGRHFSRQRGRDAASRPLPRRLAPSAASQDRSVALPPRAAPGAAAAHCARGARAGTPTRRPRRLQALPGGARRGKELRRRSRGGIAAGWHARGAAAAWRARWAARRLHPSVTVSLASRPAPASGRTCWRAALGRASRAAPPASPLWRPARSGRRPRWRRRRVPLLRRAAPRRPNEPPPPPAARVGAPGGAHAAAAPPSARARDVCWLAPRHGDSRRGRLLLRRRRRRLTRSCTRTGPRGCCAPRRRRAPAGGRGGWRGASPGAAAMRVRERRRKRAAAVPQPARRATRDARRPIRAAQTAPHDAAPRARPGARGAARRVPGARPAAAPPATFLALVCSCCSIADSSPHPVRATPFRGSPRPHSQPPAAGRHGPVSAKAKS
jgi:hypothetical protein